MKMTFRCKNGIGLINYIDKNNFLKYEIVNKGQGIGETIRKIRSIQEEK